MRTRLQNLRNQIDAIKTRADSVDSRQQIEFERQLDLLYAKQDLAEEKLKRISQATDPQSRTELKTSFDAICVEIENAIDSAWAKLG